MLFSPKRAGEGLGPHWTSNKAPGRNPAVATAFLGRIAAGDVLPPQ
jgi:hypothetical protein